MDRSELLGKLRCLATLLQQLNAQTAAAAVMEAVNQLGAPPPPAEPAGGEWPEPAMVFSALNHDCRFSDGFELLDDTANFYSEAQMQAALSQRPVVDEATTVLRKIAKRNLRSLIERLGDDADKRTMLLCLEELS